jgi:hypothetical protein
MTWLKFKHEHPKKIVKYNYIIGCDYIVVVANPNSLKKDFTHLQ